jgi:hypothetical protein
MDSSFGSSSVSKSGKVPRYPEGLELSLSDLAVADSARSGSYWYCKRTVLKDTIVAFEFANSRRLLM